MRDLAPGPRRFTELFDGLPGIATDVLADRLRSLEAAGAVEQRERRHPAPARVYALTPRGEELARLAGELGRWGLPLLPSPTTAAGAALRKNPRWTLACMARGYSGGLSDGEYRWTIGEEELRVDVRGATATIGYGHGTGTPVLDVRCTAAALFAMVRRGVPGNEVHVHVGARDLLVAYLTAMPLTIGTGY